MFCSVYYYNTFALFLSLIKMAHALVSIHEQYIPCPVCVKQYSVWHRPGMDWNKCYTVWHRPAMDRNKCLCKLDREFSTRHILHAPIPIQEWYLLNNLALNFILIYWFWILGEKLQKVMANGFKILMKFYNMFIWMSVQRDRFWKHSHLKLNESLLVVIQNKST